MSEEYNRYDLGNDPEEKSETPKTTAAQETMETAEAVDTETAATTENTESAENTSYAFSYRKAGEERKDQENGESFTRTYTGSHREYTHDSGQNQNSDQNTQSPYTAGGLPILFPRFPRNQRRSIKIKERKAKADR